MVWAGSWMVCSGVGLSVLEAEQVAVESAIATVDHSAQDEDAQVWFWEGLGVKFPGGYLICSQNYIRRKPPQTKLLPLGLTFRARD
jgi:hypothetical protein